MDRRNNFVSSMLCGTMLIVSMLIGIGCTSGGTGDTGNQQQPAQSGGNSQQSVSQPGGTPAAGQPGSGQGQGGQPAMDTSSIASALGIDQAKLDAAITQAQSELQATMTTQPTGAPSTGTPPTGTPPADGGSGGGNNKLLTRVAEILGIDLTKLQDAFSQNQPQRTGAPPTTAK